MKILHVVGDSAYGGGSRIIAALAERAAAEGHAVSVLTTCRPFQDDLLGRGVEVIALDCIWRPIRPWRDLHGLLRLRAHLCDQRYDVVHTHTSKAGFVGRLAARLAHTPVTVHTIHGFAFHDRSPRWQIVIFTALERLAACWADRIVTVADYLRERALALGIADRERLVAIPNGVARPRALAEDSAKARNSLGVPDDAAVLLTTGRLAPDKGLEYLIAALPRIAREAGRPVRLLFAGDGPLRAALGEWVGAAGCADQVRFLGFRPDVWTLLAAADIVVLPSLREGLSISLLEAMAIGRPIVATRIPGNVEASDGGAGALLVPCADPPALADAVLRLMRDAELARRLGGAALDLYERRYLEQLMLDRYMDLYRGIALRKLPSLDRHAGDGTGRRRGAES